MKRRASQYQFIQRQSILTGKLIPGERLPSTRTLAESLGISRGTVKLGYEQLLNEGYLETVNGSGTFVCQQISDQSLPAIPLQPRCNGTLITTGLSQYAQNFVTRSLPKPSQAKRLVDRHSPLLEQCVLADFINEGHLERHLRRMRTLYNQRRQALIQSLKSRLGEDVTILGDAAGIHLMVQLQTGMSDQEIMVRAAQMGVGLSSAATFYLGSSRRGEFLLGYANLDEEKIDQGIHRLAQVLGE